MKKLNKKKTFTGKCIKHMSVHHQAVLNQFQVPLNKLNFISIDTLCFNQDWMPSVRKSFVRIYVLPLSFTFTKTIFMCGMV